MGVTELSKFPSVSTEIPNNILLKINYKHKYLFSAYRKIRKCTIFRVGDNNLLNYDHGIQTTRSNTSVFRDSLILQCLNFGHC